MDNKKLLWIGGGLAGAALLYFALSGKKQEIQVLPLPAANPQIPLPSKPNDTSITYNPLPSYGTVATAKLNPKFQTSFNPIILT